MTHRTNAESKLVPPGPGQCRAGSGAGTVRPGVPPSEFEMKEKKARVEDALHATRAAVEEGIVPGGGVALIRASAKLEDLKGASPDQDLGIGIARRAMEEPLRQIVANAGMEPAVVLRKVVEGEGAFGFNAQTEEYGDLVQTGILDPTKVVRCALQNAASIAGLLITTEAGVAEKPEKEKAHVHPPGDMGGMDF